MVVKTNFSVKLRSLFWVGVGVRVWSDLTWPKHDLHLDLTLSWTLSGTLSLTIWENLHHLFRVWLSFWVLDSCCWLLQQDGGLQRLPSSSSGACPQDKNCRDHILWFPGYEGLWLASQRRGLLWGWWRVLPGSPLEEVCRDHWEPQLQLRPPLPLCRLPGRPRTHNEASTKVPWFLHKRKHLSQPSQQSWHYYGQQHLFSPA